MYIVLQTGVPLAGSCTNTTNCTANTANSECKAATCQCKIAYYAQKNTCVLSKYSKVEFIILWFLFQSRSTDHNYQKHCVYKCKYVKDSINTGSVSTVRIATG